MFAPKIQTDKNDGAYGIIDSVKDVQTTQVATEVDFSANVTDVFIGHVLAAVFGDPTPCVKFPIPGSITGTFSEGETITESTSSATGVLKRADVGGSSKALYISAVSGTFTGGQTLTGGTSGATATGGTIESPSAVRFHTFHRLNTNTPLTYTIYGSDPVSDDRAVYCAIDSFDFECVTGQFCKISTKWMGKKLASTTAQTPTYATEYPFLAKAASVKLASAFTSLDAASAINVESFKLSIPKNLALFQAFGSTDLTSLHNQDWGPITGEMTLLYNAITYRDYVIASTKQAIRFAVTNPATIGSAANPTLQFDIPSAGLEFSRTTENAGLVRQTLKFTCEYDVTTTYTIRALLANTRTTTY